MKIECMPGSLWLTDFFFLKFFLEGIASEIFQLFCVRFEQSKFPTTRARPTCELRTAATTRMELAP